MRGRAWWIAATAAAFAGALWVLIGTPFAPGGEAPRETATSAIPGTPPESDRPASRPARPASPLAAAHFSDAGASVPTGFDAEIAESGRPPVVVQVVAPTARRRPARKSTRTPWTTAASACFLHGASGPTADSSPTERAASASSPRARTCD